LQVLTITTIAFLGFVTIWVTRLEDYLEARTTERHASDDRPETGRE
jgi:hypothetical protein